MHSKLVIIHGLRGYDEYSHLMSHLSMCAKKGILQYRIGGPVVDPSSFHVAITVYSENEGSVRAICEQFLIPISNDPRPEVVAEYSTSYRQGIDNWVAGEQTKYT